MKGCGVELRVSDLQMHAWTCKSSARYETCWTLWS